MVKLSLFATATESRVDADSGILRGVRVITKGEAKGHSFLGEPIIVDDQTIAEVVESAASFPDGVPVKLAHGTDIEELVGSIRNIINDGDCARGDLHLLKNHESYATIIEMAETMPSNFGISISFMNAPEPVKGNDMEPDGDEDDTDPNQGINPQYQDGIVAYAARVCELYSADLVQAPACNPSLFSMSEPTATPEVPAEAEEVKVEEIAPAAEAPAEEVALNAVIESEPAPEVPAEEVVEKVADKAPEVAAEAPAESPEAEEVKEELEVKGPEGTQNLPEEKKAEKPEEKKVPDPKELSQKFDGFKSEFEATKVELSRVTTELSAVRTELTAAREELAVKEASLVELNMLHRSVLSVMGLAPSIEIPEISEAAPATSVIEQYESMPPGPERLSFFQANRREIERSIAEKLK